MKKFQSPRIVMSGGMKYEKNNSNNFKKIFLK